MNSHQYYQKKSLNIGGQIMIGRESEDKCAPSKEVTTHGGVGGSPQRPIIIVGNQGRPIIIGAAGENFGKS